MSDLTDLENEYASAFYIDDFEIMEVVWATYIAAARPGINVWLRVKGPPSFTKTTLTAPLEGMDTTIAVSNMTTSTLVSGFKKAVPLLKVLDGNVMVINDASALGSQPADKRGQIYAQLRDAFDGTWAHWFGGDVQKVVGNCRFGSIWACTRAIEQDAMFAAKLGERFLDVCVRNTNRQKKTRQAILNASKTDAIKKHIRTVTSTFVKKVWDNPVVIPPFTQDQSDELILISDFVSKAMTPVMRDYHTRQVSQIPDPTGPMRVAQQLMRLAHSLSEIRSVSQVRDEEMATIRRVAMDCVTLERMRVLELVKATPTICNKPIADTLHLHHSVTQRILDDLTLLELVDAKESLWGTGVRYTYTLTSLSEEVLK